jgi:hypothetical protein
MAQPRYIHRVHRWAVAAIAVAALLAPLNAAAQARLTSPDAGQMVHSNDGIVPVVVTGAPADARFVAVLDGQRQPARESSAFEIAGVDRGAHTLSVLIVDGDGRVTGTTGAVEFHVWQASRLFPARRGR